MGGYGTARFGFKYPHLFGAISMINPGPMQEILIPKEAPLAGEVRAQQTLDKVYGGDIEYFRQLSPWLLAEKNVNKIQGNINIRMILGGSDPSLPNNKRFSEHLENLNIKHTVTILELAGHSPKAMFSALGDDYWVFFNQNFSSLED
jgi:esterase/lipase superfamily enzyme